MENGLSIDIVVNLLIAITGGLVSFFTLKNKVEKVDLEQTKLSDQLDGFIVKTEKDSKYIINQENMNIEKLKNEIQMDTESRKREIDNKIEKINDKLSELNDRYKEVTEKEFEKIKNSFDSREKVMFKRIDENRDEIKKINSHVSSVNLAIVNLENEIKNFKNYEHKHILTQIKFIEDKCLKTSGRIEEIEKEVFEYYKESYKLNN